MGTESPFALQYEPGAFFCTTRKTGSHPGLERLGCMVRMPAKRYMGGADTRKGKPNNRTTPNARELRPFPSHKEEHVNRIPASASTVPQH